MQQIPFINLFIDRFKSALHVLGYKLAHLQENFLTVYTVKKKMGEFVSRNMYSRFKTINEKINKRNLLQLVGCLHRSSNHCYKKAWMCTCIHTYTHIYIHTHTHIYIHTYTHTYTYIHTYTHTHIYTYIHSHIHTRTGTRTRTRTHTHTHVLHSIEKLVGEKK